MNFLNISHLPNPRIYLFLSVPISASFPLIPEEVTSLFWLLANSFTCAGKFPPTSFTIILFHLSSLATSPMVHFLKTNKQNFTIPIFLFPFTKRTGADSTPLVICRPPPPQTAINSSPITPLKGLWQNCDTTLTPTPSCKIQCVFFLSVNLS